MTEPTELPKGKDPLDQAFNSIAEDASKALAKAVKEQAQKVIAAHDIFQKELQKLTQVKAEATAEYQRNREVLGIVKSA